MARDQKPFYWVQPPQPGDEWYVAPTGWYQWTERGLIYLGPTILESLESAGR